MTKSRAGSLIVLCCAAAACGSHGTPNMSVQNNTSATVPSGGAGTDAGTSAGATTPALAGRASQAVAKNPTGAAGSLAATPASTNAAAAASAAGSGGSDRGMAAGQGGTVAPAAGGGGNTSSAGANAGASAMAPSNPWPVGPDGWPTATPSDLGLDKMVIDGLGDRLQAVSGNTRAGLVVVKEGVLVYEKYWQGAADTLHTVYSCTKSWGSTLIGIAVHQGLLSVEDPVTKWVPQPAREVGMGALLKHLLTQTAHTTPPGMSFAYNSGSIVNTLPEVLEAASKMSSHAFFETFLAKPLQLTMVWPTCPAGGCAGTRYKADYIQFGDQGPNPVLQSTIRDQAKLGWLWLNDGVWNGERLIDSDYIRAGSQPSFDFQAVYGYLWWLNREGRSSILSYDADVPNDAIHAVGGIGNCSVGVFPTQRLVIVHTGEGDSGGLGGHWDVFAPLFK
ncbi:MAG TPA: serine hydrolase [Polyangiales bacterium]|nr:serine hydrolase [Polyangiales bacterium]